MTNEINFSWQELNDWKRTLLFFCPSATIPEWSQLRPFSSSWHQIDRIIGWFLQSRRVDDHHRLEKSPRPRKQLFFLIGVLWSVRWEQTEVISNFCGTVAVWRLDKLAHFVGICLKFYWQNAKCLYGWIFYSQTHWFILVLPKFPNYQHTIELRYNWIINYLRLKWYSFSRHGGKCGGIYEALTSTIPDSSPVPWKNTNLSQNEGYKPLIKTFKPNNVSWENKS